MYINNYFQYNLYITKEILSKALLKKRQAVSTTVTSKLPKDL